MSAVQPLSNELPRYRLGEEIANALIHGIGLALAIAGLVVLILDAARYGSARDITAVSIYGACLVLMYSASTLYHAIPQPRAKILLRQLDHASIFLLIAGTYTPFTLAKLHAPWGWSLFGITWGLAATGLLLQKQLKQRRLLAVLLYIAMGWVALIAIRPLAHAVAPIGITLLVSGGLAYTLGTIFYGWRRLPYGHAVWHTFVLIGSALHFFAILYFVVLPD